MKNNFQLSKVAASLAVIGGVSLFSGQIMAAVPLAGTNISNVATASYTDNTGTERVVTSNEVKTLVAQVGSFTLEANRSAQTTPNGQVTFSHILTNTGNGTDKFAITLSDVDDATTTFDFENGKFAIYIDRNKDGVADSKIALTTSDRIELAAGESVGLVVVATTPSTAVANQLDKLQVSATAQSTTLYDASALTKTNIDTTTITTGAVMQITKAASVSVTQAGQEVEYTLTFKNTGNASATNVAIFDVLPATVQFVAGSARYNGSSVALTDAKDVADKFEVSGNKFLFNIDSVAANTSGKLTFKVKVLDTTSAGDIKNTAYVDPDGKTGPSGGPNIPLIITDVPDTAPIDPTTVPSNPSIVTVTGKYDGSINDSVLNSFKDGTIPGAPIDDRITLAGKQGVPVVFGDSATEGDMIVVHNRGNTTDSYTLSVDKTNLPAGSIVEILKVDGKTPVTSNNTGPIAAGAYEKYIVRVTFQNGAVVSNNQIILTSTSDANKGTDRLTLVVSSLLANAVDLVSKTPTADLGIGAGTSTPVSSATTPPATPTTFDITIKNTGNIPDNYIITVPNIPTGWIAEVYEKDVSGNCTATKVTNSGNVANGAAKSFCLIVTPPAGTPADTVTGKDIKVEISSPATGTNDDITFNVKVAEQRQLTFSPDRQGQVAPGGTLVYSHTLTNTGNVLEGETKYPIEINWSSTLLGMNTSVYVDLNKNGTIDANELVTGATVAARNASLTALLAQTNGAGLSQNESVTILVKVEAPATATAGESDTTIVTFKPTGTNKPADIIVTDRTVINLGQVRLVKTQAVAECATVPTVYGTTDLQAKPGQCVYYKIVATNDGNANATNVVIADMVPSYTQLYSGSLKPAAATQTNGQVSYTVNTLTPATSATLEFAVKVDN
ncbi:DUF7619 domain-containing protein [Acinetobacter albensis]|uniref:Conserved repeat domain-containing protein n=1 Tax=Acinetobacter albensis TaxID=1673609 RepID=A0A1C4GWC4_9GAMM|nr:DUF11 domain-containing protein [Acinetobacter albensis]SCC72472.1 conserved repeat domain-containing protein [Acinetobacter albensis]